MFFVALTLSQNIDSKVKQKQEQKEVEAFFSTEMLNC
jgi:hypothetical protein